MLRHVVPSNPGIMNVPPPLARRPDVPASATKRTRVVPALAPHRRWPFDKLTLRRDSGCPEQLRTGRVTPSRVEGWPFGQLRERLDVAIFVRGLVGTTAYPLLRVIPRWRLHVPKEYFVHAAILLIVGVVIAANLFTTSADRGSLLFALFGEGEIEEGPVPRPDQVTASRRGALLGLIPPASAGGVTENDIEFELANTLGGNALLATGSPETAEASIARRQGMAAVRVQEGDTPSSIAARFGVSTNTILWANGIRDGDIIRPGDILVVLPVSGVLHTVVAGDDVTSLAGKYDAKVEDIIARNGLSNEGGIRVGQKLIIPDGQIRRAAPALLASHEPETAPEAETPASPPENAPEPGLDLLWPTATRKISQYFGWRHTGIDLPAKGTQVAKAAQDGTVKFAGWLGGYGRLVVVDHGVQNGRRMETLYAHLREIHVEPGQTVSRGESVGYLGCTGFCTGQHLHLEVRKDGRPVNPLGEF